MNKTSENSIVRLCENAQSFFATPFGKIVAGSATTVLGFIIDAIVLKQNKKFACQLLDEIHAVNENVNIDQIKKVIEGFFSPWSLSTIIYAILWFFVGIVLADLISVTDTHKEIREEDWKSENIIVDLLDHLTDQVYNRCSNCTDHCGQCSKFASEDDGLIRRYLYEESKHLKQAISKSKEGEYSLDNNIPKFHTFAITHMLQTSGKQYSVIQWIGSDPYTDQNQFDETFDSLDFRFLYTLLKKVTEPSHDKKGNPYYKIKLAKSTTFKIKWILIGDVQCMKNNFDYIFCVIKQFSNDNNIGITEQMNIIKEFYEFYIIDERKYRREIDDILTSYSGDSYKLLFHLDNKPSFGIFGDQFMFVDSLDQASHGSIYTRKYVPIGAAQSLVDASIKIFSSILNKSEKQDIFDLLELYKQILTVDPGWEKHLESIWDKSRKEED